MAMKVSASGDGKRSTPAIKVAVAAVALSVAVMLAAIAIVLGFKDEITRKVTGFNPHIVLKTNQAISEGEYLVSLTPTLQQLLDETPYVSSYSLAASVPAILKTDSDFKGIYLRSGSKDAFHDFLQSQLVEGTLPDFSAGGDSIVVSQIAADQLLLKVGDTVPSYFFTDKIAVEPLKVAGIFNSHFTSYDDILAFGPLPFIQGTGDLPPSEGTTLNIYIDDFSRLDEYAVDLRHRLDMAFSTGLIYRYYDIETALTSGANFFGWLALLDTNVIVILALMTAVALVTLISGMLILTVDKNRFVVIMRALGAPSSMIRKIFVWLTLKVAFWGLLIGNAVILAILCLQQTYHFIPLDADSYYIDFVPVKLNFLIILLLNVGVLLVTFVMLRIFSLRTVRVRNLLEG